MQPFAHPSYYPAATSGALAPEITPVSHRPSACNRYVEYVGLNRPGEYDLEDMANVLKNPGPDLEGQCSRELDALMEEDAERRGIRVSKVRRRFRAARKRVLIGQLDENDDFAPVAKSKTKLKLFGNKRPLFGRRHPQAEEEGYEPSWWEGDTAKMGALLVGGAVVGMLGYAAFFGGK